MRDRNWTFDDRNSQFDIAVVRHSPFAPRTSDFGTFRRPFAFDAFSCGQSENAFGFALRVAHGMDLQRKGKAKKKAA